MAPHNHRIVHESSQGPSWQSPRSLGANHLPQLDTKAENIGMRSDTDISYKLLVFPYRELVSDFVRARRVPYCNVELPRVDCCMLVMLVKHRLARLLPFSVSKSCTASKSGF